MPGYVRGLTPLVTFNGIYFLWQTESEISTNIRRDQELAIVCLHLLQVGLEYTTWDYGR